jgi:ABC-type transport system substrate-binding protein
VKTRVALSALAATSAALLLASGGGAGAIKEGGTFRIGVVGSFPTVDPAIQDLYHLGPACARLLDTPPKPLPAGRRFEPELAESYPIVSRNGRTYTFTIRKGARFSNGARVLARDVVHSLERVLSPVAQSALAPTLVDIVGAQALLDGKATRLSGAVAKGRTLVLRLRKPVSDFPIRASVCVVPASLPVHPEGVKAPIASPAPYYVAEFVPDERVVLERNRFYGGALPHHPARFVIEMGSDPGTIVERVKSGDLELSGLGSPAMAPFVSELTRRYGVNRSQFHSVPGDFLRMFVLNTSRPLFRNNPRLRQAINFAVDRRALVREFGPGAGTPTDQYMAPNFPGFRNERIYPLEAPDLSRARTLARGRIRSGKAVLYIFATPVGLAQAQILERNLKAIGLELEVVQFPPGSPLLFQKLATPGEPFDIGWIGWLMRGPDGVGLLHDGRTIGQPGSLNYSYFDSQTFNRLIAAAAALPLGRARERAYGELDVRLSKEAAPGIPYGVTNEITFVSSKVGCIVLNPALDLNAVCLK